MRTMALTTVVMLSNMMMCSIGRLCRDLVRMSVNVRLTKMRSLGVRSLGTMATLF